MGASPLFQAHSQLQAPFMPPQPQFGGYGGYGGYSSFGDVLSQYNPQQQQAGYSSYAFGPPSSVFGQQYHTPLTPFQPLQQHDVLSSRGRRSDGMKQIGVRRPMI